MIGQVGVVLGQQLPGDGDVVDVGKDESAAAGVARACLNQGGGVIAPVAARVQVMAGVVAIVEAVSVALFPLLSQSVLP